MGTNGGNGGAGTASSISGSSVTYAGGGGGGGYTPSGTGGTGGSGGGGAGGNASAVGTAGTANTGGGGGGGGGAGSGAAVSGGNGGSGVVIIAYHTADFSAFTVTGGTKTTAGSDTVHTFNASGNLVVTANAVAPVADFSGTPTSGSAPLSVTFTDASSNTPTSWAWTFGDGGTSTSQNPSHTYSNPGSYTVALTATNAGGSDSETKADYISILGGGGSSKKKKRRGKTLRYSDLQGREMHEARQNIAEKALANVSIPIEHTPVEEDDDEAIIFALVSKVIH